MSAYPAWRIPMKALLSKHPGGPETLALDEVPEPVPGSKEVRVAVRACGVNYPDLLIIQDLYQYKPPRPFAPGAEIAGVVDAVGEGVEHLHTGDRVLLSPVRNGMAEKAVGLASNCWKIPDTMPFDQAAALIMTYGTSQHALKDRAQLLAGETLLVLGAAGGVGLAAVELGKLMGARVIAAASTDDKLEVCRSRGADATINYSSEDLRERLKALTDGRGVDVVYDPVGGEYSEMALRSMAWRGRFLVVGFANGEIPKIPLNLALLKGCSIVGVFWGEFARRERDLNAANLKELTAWLRAKKIKPLVSASYPLERAADALNDMMNRKVQGKVVLTTE